MSDEKPRPKRQSHTDAAGLLYRLTIAFSHLGGRDPGRLFYLSVPI
jgi:hypothetical protein